MAAADTPAAAAATAKAAAVAEAAGAGAVAVAVGAAAADVAAAVAEAAAKGRPMTKLETATHVFLIAVCCLAGGLLIEQRFFSDNDSATPGLVGREVRLPGADWQSAPVSVLLQISSTCHFCNDSMPFYRKLMATRQASAAKIPVIVASADAVPVMQHHLVEQQVSVDKVLHSRLEGFDAVTPTVYIVDSKGMIKRVFVGELDPSGQKELLSIVKRGKV